LIEGHDRERKTRRTIEALMNDLSKKNHGNKDSVKNGAEKGARGPATHSGATGHLCTSNPAGAARHPPDEE